VSYERLTIGRLSFVPEAVCYPVRYSAHPHRWDAHKSRSVFPIQDTAAVVQSLMLTAVEHGLGACWISSFSEGDVVHIVQLPLDVPQEMGNA